MTPQEFIDYAGHNSIILLIWFISIPVLSWFLGVLHGPDNGVRSPWKYVYTFFVYVVCLPGILAAVLTAYSLFIIKQNLLQTNFLIYFLPVVSMVVTLLLIRQNVKFEDIPGFDRLSGLLAIIAITFVLVLAIEKTRIWLFFGGSITRLILLVGGLFALLKWGVYMLFRKKDESKLKPPSFPS